MSRLLTLLVTLAACGSPKPPPSMPPKQPPPISEPTKPAPSIGVATMLDDGTLQLQLRAEGEGGIVGDALLTYPPTHRQYDYILKHLGPMKPGDSKPVAPFPEN